MTGHKMRQTVAKAISGDKRLGELVSAACGTLEDLIEIPGPEIRADWSLASDSQGRSVVLLTLSDDTGSVNTSFTVDDLEKPREMRSRLNWTLGGLLKIRTHKLLEKLVDHEP